MHRIRKILAAILLVATLLTGINVHTEKVQAASQVEIALNKARSYIGSHAFDGYCQRFVRISYEAAGINGWAGSATIAGNAWIQSTGRNNIPVGAAVYFTGNTAYGHVGIYVGNGCMIHANDGVREEPISDYWWARYRGWGYQGGVMPTGAYVNLDQNGPKVTDVEVTIGKDEAFYLSAKVSDDKELDYAVFSLKSDISDKKFYSATITDGVATRRVPFTDFGDYEGFYQVMITAVDSSNNQTTVAGNTISRDTIAPVIEDVEIEDIGFGTYKVSFNASDNSDFNVCCYYDDKEVLVRDDEGFYAYIDTDNEALHNVQIVATDIARNIHEKNIELQDFVFNMQSDNEKDDMLVFLYGRRNLFARMNLEYPFARFIKDASGEAIVEDNRVISYDIFNFLDFRKETKDGQN